MVLVPTVLYITTPVPSVSLTVMCERVTVRHSKKYKVLLTCRKCGSFTIEKSLLVLLLGKTTKYYIV